MFKVWSAGRKRYIGTCHERPFSTKRNMSSEIFFPRYSSYQHRHIISNNTLPFNPQSVPLPHLPALDHLPTPFVRNIPTMHHPLSLSRFHYNLHAIGTLSPPSHHHDLSQRHLHRQPPLSPVLQMRQEIALIANTITQYERVGISAALVNVPIAAEYVSPNAAVMGVGVTKLWVRDRYAAVPVIDSNGSEGWG